jgi:putative endonuclease
MTASQTYPAPFDTFGRVLSTDQDRVLTWRKKHPMTAWVYILECIDGSYYTGSTGNLELRIAQHRAGEGGAYTAKRLPVTLVYSCEFQTEHEAFLRERQVKGWSRKKKEALIRGDFEALIELSKSQSSQR